MRDYADKSYLRRQRVVKRKRNSRHKLGQPKRESFTITMDAAVVVAVRECARRREMQFEDYIAEQIGNVAVDEIPHMCGVTLSDFLSSRRAFVEGD